VCISCGRAMPAATICAPGCKIQHTSRQMKKRPEPEEMDENTLQATLESLYPGSQPTALTSLVQKMVNHPFEQERRFNRVYQKQMLRFFYLQQLQLDKPLSIQESNELEDLSKKYSDDAGLKSLIGAHHLQQQLQKQQQTRRHKRDKS